jgi:ubiquinone/menaquinone biosynthesis C-methylase UbiE
MSRTKPEVSAEQVEAAWGETKLAQVIYHDWEATSYDDKWSISYDERCTSYARDRVAAVSGTEEWPYGASLEVGGGTGFFTLNLALAGVLAGPLHITDLSPGMVEQAEANAAEIGLSVTGSVADVENLPFDDDSFDVVIGHAMLHHIPDVERALMEMLRVLRPGGRFIICGEPSRWGDKVARALSRATWETATRVTRLPGLRGGWARSKEELAETSRAAELEWVVDLHTFDPVELRRTALRAGAIEVETVCEELTASWFGWPYRTLEYAVRPDRIGPRWAAFGYRSWRGFMALDRALSVVVPAGLFYNVSVTGVKP